MLGIRLHCSAHRSNLSSSHCRCFVVKQPHSVGISLSDGAQRCIMADSGIDGDQVEAPRPAVPACRAWGEAARCASLLMQVRTWE